MRPFPVLLLAILFPVTGRFRSEAPPQRQPKVPIPAVWNSGKALQGTVDVHWWKQFQDPQLDALIEESLHNNPQLRAVADRLDTAVNQARIAGADLIPSMGFALNGRRQRQNFIGLPLPGFAGRVPQSTYTLMGVALDISWEADLWGRIRSGEIRAGALASAQSADLAAARHSLAAQTAKAWFASTEAHLQLLLARETVASFKVTSQWVQNRFEAGFQPALELRLVRADLSYLLGNLAQPIFQGGRLRRQVDIARSRSEEALEIYTDAVLQAFGEVETALSVESLLRERLRELEESAAEARAARKQAQLRYRHGQGNVPMVLETERRILDFESQILTLQHLLLDNRIDLHLALGGGFDPNAPPGSPGALLPAI